MAQYHLRILKHRFLPPMVLGASVGTSVVEKVNSALAIFLAFLLLLTSWRFLRLLRGEKRLKELLQK